MGKASPESYHFWFGQAEARAEDDAGGLERACQDAWDNRPTALRDEPLTVRVLEIQFDGSNPIDMWRVIVTNI